jgi:hypothetical protein
VDGGAAPEPGGCDPGVAGRAAAGAEPARRRRAQPPRRVRPAACTSLALLRSLFTCEMKRERERDKERDGEGGGGQRDPACARV